MLLFRFTYHDIFLFIDTLLFLFIPDIRLAGDKPSNFFATHGFDQCRPLAYKVENDREKLKPELKTEVNEVELHC